MIISNIHEFENEINQQWSGVNIRISKYPVKNFLKYYKYAQLLGSHRQIPRIFFERLESTKKKNCLYAYLCLFLLGATIF